MRRAWRRSLVGLEFDRSGWWLTSAWPGLLLVLTLILAPSGASRAGDGNPWGQGYFPDVTLTTHEGESVRFYQDVLKGKVVAINFMFTSCENVCPAETARLLQVEALLKGRLGEDIHFYSISIDPEVDTPEALAQYRERFGVGPGWTFLTASREPTDLIQRKLGLLVEKLDDPDDHNASLVLGNEASGRWLRRSPYDDPKRLAHILAESLHNWSKPPRSDRNLASYDSAPSRSNWETGEKIYRTRCASCHTIGEGDALGPDLAGVTERRDRDWLVRWIMEPDVMIAEGDPEAVKLLREWDNLRMPDFGLNRKEAEGILAFIEKGSVSPVPAGHSLSMSATDSRPRR